MREGGRIPATDVEQLPRALVRAARTLPLTRQLFVAAAGVTPGPRGRAAERRAGMPELLVFGAVGGMGWTEVAGVRRPLGPGQAIAMPPRVAHSYGSSVDPWPLWWVILDGAAVGEVQAALGVDAANPVFEVADSREAVAGVAAILERIRGDPTIWGAVDASSLVWPLLATLSAGRFRPGPGDPVERVRELLERDPDSPVRIADLAAAVSLSPSRLRARFRAATGSSITAYLAEVRMARARTLLDGSASSVAEVGRRTGYPDPDYFARVFRRVHGVSPTVYRARSIP